MTVPAISYRGVCKIYEKSHLGRVTRTTGLDGLDLDIEKSEIYGILGLNGAGKTTAMKLALGLLFATSGTVSVGGAPAGSTEGKRRIGYLPELPYFYSHLTPAESLLFYARLSGVPQKGLMKKAEDVLAEVGLSQNAHKRVSEFSKGMMQRLGLAQALIHDPEILILDEPVSGLDPLAVWDFRELLLRLNKEGRTVFLSSHSISELEKVCHRVGILYGGRLALSVTQEQWQGEGGLEKIFVDTVRNKCKA